MCLHLVAGRQLRHNTARNHCCLCPPRPSARSLCTVVRDVTVTSNEVSPGSEEDRSAAPVLVTDEVQRRVIVMGAICLTCRL